MIRKEKVKKAKGTGFLPGQATLEFTFCMVITFFMIYGLIMVFRWVGVDLAERRRAHKNVLFQSIDEDWSDVKGGPLKQIKPHFYKTSSMDAVLSPY